MCVRLGAFSIFIVAAFTFQWLYNFIVSDVPARVTLKIQRRRYVVSKALEAEMAYDKWLKSTLHGKTSTGVPPPINIVNGIARPAEAQNPPNAPPKNNLAPQMLEEKKDGDSESQKSPVRRKSTSPPNGYAGSAASRIRQPSSPEKQSPPEKRSDSTHTAHTTISTMA